MHFTSLRELLTEERVRTLKKCNSGKNIDIDCYLHKNYKSLQTSTNSSFLSMRDNK